MENMQKIFGVLWLQGLCDVIISLNEERKDFF